MEAQPNAAQLQALIIPLKSWNLILPQSLVAEVLPMPEVRLTDSDEQWFRGSIEWRGAELPLVSIDAYCFPSKDDAQQRTRRVAVLQSVGEGIEHYALEIYSIPHPLRLVESEVQVNEVDGSCELVAIHVKVSGVQGVIPNLDLIEREIVRVMA